MALHSTKYLRPTLLRKSVWEPYIGPAISLLRSSASQCCLSGSQYWWATKDISTHVNRSTDWVAKTTTWDNRPSLLLPLCFCLSVTALRRILLRDYRNPRSVHTGEQR